MNRKMKLISVVTAFVIAGYILALFISPVYVNPFLSDKMDGRVIITAHRGGAGLGQENNLLIIEKTLRSKPAQIEADVQMTADSVLVLFHDKTLQRLYHSDATISGLKWKELLSISTAFPDNKITRFDDVLGLMNGKSEFLIEVKRYDNYNSAIEKILSYKIDSIQGYKWCIIQSFDEHVLQRLHQLNPKIRLAKLILGKVPFSETYFDYDLKAEKLDDLDFCESFHANAVFTTRSLVDMIHNRDKKVKVWTVNNASTMKKFASLGVDGIITDYPDLYDYK